MANQEHIVGVNWVCPHCNRPQTMTMQQSAKASVEFFGIAPSKHGHAVFEARAINCANPDCRELTFEGRLVVGFRAPIPGGGYHLLDPKSLGDFRLRPRSSARSWPEFIPAQLREDYEESCLISALSPKASATLSRRCLQGMIRDFCGIKKGTLDAEIRELRQLAESGSAPKGVELETLDSIDAIRAVGNIGAHMEKDVNSIVPVEENEAQLLIKIIEMLFDGWYVSRDKREKQLAEVKKMATQKQAQKKAATSGGASGGSP